ncbi:MAG: hypothetical protein BJ554DRAFT_4719 [Olpidium bornovanus]|uniref:Uncharacterized protein n=1 Tax=Olpidium bornovanus TaxID=278681 RepID=A0A8H7ZLS4_9FUNG|nr:MAG: hypothetical protein BJ554DRAFT_4719 [Olpidium bornovanus]
MTSFRHLVWWRTGFRFTTSSYDVSTSESASVGGTLRGTGIDTEQSSVGLLRDGRDRRGGAARRRRRRRRQQGVPRAGVAREFRAAAVVRVAAPLRETRRRRPRGRPG